MSNKTFPHPSFPQDTRLKYDEVSKTLEETKEELDSVTKENKDQLRQLQVRRAIV